LKILHVTPWYAPAWATGGTAVSVSSYCEALAAQAVDVTVFTTTDKGRGERLHPSSFETVREGVVVKYFACGVFGIKARQAALSWRMFWQIFKCARDFDVIHVHSTRHIYGLAVLISSKIFKVPYIVTPHASLMSFWVNGMGNPLLKKLYLLTIERFVLSSASAIHYLSSFERQASSSWGFNSASVIVPNGISMDRDLMGVSRSGRLCGLKLLQVGRIHPQKNTLELIKAVASLSDYEVSLDIVGPVDDEMFYRKCLAVLAEEEVSNVAFLGLRSLDEVLESYATYDLICLPSLCEGVSMALIEAARAGLPALVSDQVGNYLEIIDDNAGLVCGTSSDSIARVLRRVLEDPAIVAQMSEGALRSARERYEVKKNALLLKETYEGIWSASTS
jgi:glycosyltransferase involved in cell wall biosynthesis